MGGLIFSRKSKVDIQKDKLKELEKLVASKVKELDSQIYSKRKELSAVNKEVSRTKSQAAKSLAKIEREEANLRALVKDAAERAKVADKKESDVQEHEKALSAREKAVANEEYRINKLKKQEQQLINSVAKLLEQKREAERVLASSKKSVSKSQKESSALKSLKDEANRAVKLSQTAKAKILELEKSLRERESQLQMEKIRLEKLLKQEERLRASVGKLKDEKSEAERIILLSQKVTSKAKKEEQALRSIRANADKAVKLADAKSAEFREAERSLRQHQKEFDKKTARIQNLANHESELRDRIKKLEVDFRDKENLLSEQKRMVSKFSKQASDVVRARKDLESMQKKISELNKKNRALDRLVVQKEKRVQEGAVVVSRLEEETERHEELLRNLRNELKKLSSVKVAIDSEVSKKQSSIKSAERNLADMENAIEGVLKTKEQLDIKARTISQRERELFRLEARIDKKKSDFEVLRSEAESVSRNKQELIALLDDKKRILNDLKKAIHENSDTLIKLQEMEKEARKSAEHLTSAQSHHDKRKKMLEDKEKEIIRMEAAWVAHNKEVAEATRLLSKDKKEFADEVSSRKAELLLVKQEWDKKFRELQDEKSDLKREKADVRKLVDSDILALQQKEDDILQAISGLERDKAKLEDEERSLVKKVNELSRAKAALEREHESLNKKDKKVVTGERILKKGLKFIEDEKKKIEQDKDKIYRASRLKKMLPQMERKYNVLSKALKRLETDLIDKTIKPSVMKEFKQKEKLLNQREKGIHKEFQLLLDKERTVEDLESREHNAFTKYLKDEVERAEQGKPSRHMANPQIHSMVDDAREKVMQGDLDSAIRLVSQAELLVERLKNADQKRLLMYDIRDLKASIKLASLT